MAKAVKLMLPRSSMRHVRSRSIYVLECFINHCILPLRETLAPLLRGYEIGLKSGNTEDAAKCRKYFYECLNSHIIMHFLLTYIFFSSYTCESSVFHWGAA